MTPEKLSGFDLTQRLLGERSIEEIDTVSSGVAAELPPIFSVKDATKEQPFVEPKARPDQVSIQKYFVTHSKVFLIWRSWETCEKCKTEINTGELILPETGSYMCPHTDVLEYQRVCNHILAGNGVIVSKEHFNIKRGDRLTHMEWLEGDPKKIAEQRAKMQADNDPVYPPNPEKVFSRAREKNER
jgi:hypothetical protein